MLEKSQMKDIETLRDKKNESQKPTKLFEKISNPHMNKIEFREKLQKRRKKAKQLENP